MLTRRHIRIKVMQCIYALSLSREDSMEKQQKFLNQSIAQTFTLYLLILGIFRELHDLAELQLQQSSRKYLDNPDKAGPDALAKNTILKQLAGNSLLDEAFKKRKLKQWYLNEEYIKILFREILESGRYAEYLPVAGAYEQDRDFLIGIFKEVIAPNSKVYDFLEDEGITWVDDLPLVNTFILKQLKKLKPASAEQFFMPRLLKNQEDMEFGQELLKKTLLRYEELEKEMEGKTPNWDKERIADIDGILIKMAICELLYFPSIPERVTINEYLEIAKEYSTPKSSIFINGILDKLVKDYKKEGKLKKTGRGLL
ncbi:transcription antitermination factor NusB [Robiginitalea sp. IMCC44478]|uniref:transcription antitermination factor NusB n=1 Tax=Robiginitalea sp. IMCC44478 TaxID=3459122 RepID=UPI004042D70C